MKIKFTFHLAAGILSITFGVLLLGTWIFLMNRPGHLPIWSRSAFAMIHVITQFIASLGLLFAGAVLLMKKENALKTFLAANGFLFFTMIYSGFEYSEMVHPFFTYQLSIASVAILTYGLGLVYIWEHYIFKMEKIKTRNPFKRKETHKMA